MIPYKTNGPKYSSKPKLCEINEKHQFLQETKLNFLQFKNTYKLYTSE